MTPRYRQLLRLDMARTFLREAQSLRHKPDLHDAMMFNARLIISEVLCDEQSIRPIHRQWYDIPY